MNKSLEPKTGCFDNSCRRDIRWLLEAASDGWYLVVSPRNLNPKLLTIIARLGKKGPVQVLDGGNRFDAYFVAREAGGQPKVLNRIKLSRAFTCYQVLSLLEGTPADHVPVVVLDMLRTFYDESVPAGERKRLLQDCIAQLNRLQKTVGVAVSVYPPSILSTTILEMREMLQESSAESLIVEPSLVVPQPMRLF